MNFFKILLLFAIVTMWTSCNSKNNVIKKLVITNPLDIDRANETVSIDISELEVPESGRYLLRSEGSEAEELSQLIDSDGDGVNDVLLFQPEIPAKGKRSFELIHVEEVPSQEEELTCYSRFVPERTDDYAWENDRVAFRTFGPLAQQMKEDGVPGGTLTSGIDAWLKRVDYSIIDKWYQKETSGTGSYHEDTGEGLDNFHVGVSRGIGGSAVRSNGKYHVSKNFTSWNTHSTGPIRTSFTLTYEDWDANGSLVSETKTISLDKGNNLSHFMCQVMGADTISIGLTLHENDGVTTTNLEQGWISYWEPHGESELGTAILVPEGRMLDTEKYLTGAKDESNLYGHVQVEDDLLEYYSGFGWKKSGQFAHQEEWESYLRRFAVCIQEPLQVQYL